MKIALRTAQGRKALRTVLNQIQQREPADFEILQTVVRAVRPIDEHKDRKRGDIGEWVPYMRDIDDPATWGWEIPPSPGELFIEEALPWEELVATFAHEFGHACSSDDDLKQRHCPEYEDDEWASEMTADWYAHRWGFGELIEQMRERRVALHHGPGPGKKCEVDGKCYFVDNNFVCHRVEEDESRAVRRPNRSR